MIVKAPQKSKMLSLIRLACWLAVPLFLAAALTVDMSGRIFYIDSSVTSFVMLFSIVLVGVSSTVILFFIDPKYRLSYLAVAAMYIALMLPTILP